MENIYTEINTKGRQYEQLKGSAFSSCQGYSDPANGSVVWCVRSRGLHKLPRQQGEATGAASEVESTLGPSRMDKVGDSRHFRLRD